MVIHRGEIWWADLRDPVGSEPGYRRPVVVIQSDEFNQSAITTVLVAAITGNLKLAQAPGNVFLSHKISGLPKDSVANVSQLLTLDRAFLSGRVGKLSSSQVEELDDGLRTVMSLG